MEALAAELKTYQAKLPTLLGQAGKYVLIHGEDVEGVFDTYSEAMSAGYTKLGVDKPFFVRKISPVEQVLFFSRIQFI